MKQNFEPTLVRCCQMVAMDKYTYPAIDWEKYYKRDMMLSIVEELDRQGFIDWNVETVEENHMTMYKRFTAQLTVLPIRPPEDSPEGSNFDSNVVDG